MHRRIRRTDCNAYVSEATPLCSKMHEIKFSKHPEYLCYGIKPSSPPLIDGNSGFRLMLEWLMQLFEIGIISCHAERHERT